MLMPDAFTLAGKLALVSGAARGLGASIAEAFASFGADVCICDRDELGLARTATAIESLGRICNTAVLDVRNEEAVRAWIDSLAPLDVIVNNAGGTFHALFDDVNLKGQSSLVDENFTSVTHVVRAAVPRMVDGGSIINVTSVEAFRAAPGFAIYAAMKAAVEHLSRSLALELSDRRIRVNCIAPDALATPGEDGLAIGGDYGWKVPLGYGTPDDCAAAAVFLASDASGFITGTTLHVDGGSDAARGWRRGADGWEP
jgi:NAD(P)-dependent dehydrogenase (short-subunit alcohol dehydrogenase family)